MWLKLPLLMALCSILACGAQRENLALNKPVLSHPIQPPPPDTRPYEAAALKLYQQSDYIRALRMTYQAENLVPESPSPVLLRGLIYERGLNRPDLALLEYDRVLSQRPKRPVLAPLKPRLQHLYRLALQQNATAALTPGAPAPLGTKPLAFFPFQTWQQGKSQAAIAIGLTDLLMFDLAQTLGTDVIDCLQLHVLAATFQQAYPEADAAAFARWAGADLTISGTLLKQDDHRIALSISLLDKTGQIQYRFPTFATQLNDLGSLRAQMQNALLPILGHPQTRVTDTLHDVSPIALNLLARGLDAYLSGDAEMAFHILKSAHRFHPNSRLIQQRYIWAHADWIAHQSPSDPFSIYRLLSVYPIPETAMVRRLEATQDLLAPADGALEGQEALSPYKPPKGENLP